MKDVSRPFKGLCFEVEALQQLHSDELRSSEAAKDDFLEQTVATLRRDLEERRLGDVEEVRQELREERASAARILLEKETWFRVQITAIGAAKDKLYNDMVREKDETHQAVVAAKDAKHAEEL